MQGLRQKNRWRPVPSCRWGLSFRTQQQSPQVSSGCGGQGLCPHAGGDSASGHSNSLHRCPLGVGVKGCALMQVGTQLQDTATVSTGVLWVWGSRAVPSCRWELSFRTQQQSPQVSSGCGGQGLCPHAGGSSASGHSNSLHRCPLGVGVKGCALMQVGAQLQDTATVSTGVLWVWGSRAVPSCRWGLSFRTQQQSPQVSSGCGGQGLCPHAGGDSASGHSNSLHRCPLGVGVKGCALMQVGAQLQDTATVSTGVLWVWGSRAVPSCRWGLSPRRQRGHHKANNTCYRGHNLPPSSYFRMKLKIGTCQNVSVLQRGTRGLSGSVLMPPGKSSCPSGGSGCPSEEVSGPNLP
ncbi:uncharacterized protein LOC126085132 isoform X3 [Elephas maximus indicus]|uniref:uncharacterized protein LOC126085132 isoform X3 n=1 Tax=Elephas maximus indicus TaxID=99487 RepID=UPI002116B676|nr:uncharacterized protein LOC126085132 isoform X3 [Elephas maximus indicus]